MDAGTIFEGVFGFIIEEIIAGAFAYVLWILLSSDIRDAYATGFSNLVPLLYLIFLVILLAPVIHHLGDILDRIK